MSVTSPAPTGSPTPPSRAGAWKLLFLLAIIAGGLVVFHYTPLKQYAQPSLIKARLDAVRDRWWAGPAYVLAYAAGCVVGFPGFPMTIVGGATFGRWWGVLWVVLGANLGASVAFFLARLLGREFIDAKLQHGRLAALNERLAGRGFTSILQVRLIPAVPFNVLNFACGVTRVRWLDYALGTLLGMLPTNIAFVYFSAVVFEALVSAHPTPESRHATVVSLVIGAALFLLSLFLPYFLKKFQRAPGLS